MLEDGPTHHGATPFFVAYVPVPARVEPDLPDLLRHQIDEEVHRNRNSRRRLQDSIGHAFFDGWEKKIKQTREEQNQFLQIGGSMFAKLKREEQKSKRTGVKTCATLTPFAA